MPNTRTPLHPLLLAAFMALAAPSCSGITDPQLTEDPTDSLVVVTPPPEPGPGFRTIGYHPYWSGDRWQAYDLANLDALYFFSLEVADDGRIADSHGWLFAWYNLLVAADSADLRIVPTLSILSAETFNMVFGSETFTETLLESAAALVEPSSVGGLHLDFEVFDPVSAETRSRMTDFVRRLRERISDRRSDVTLSVFTLALDTFDAYDEVGLAESTDYLVVQGFDLHWIGDDTAGPVAALSGWGNLNWHSIVDRYASLGVPPGHMLMSAPYFGYEWPTESDAVGAFTTGRGMELTYAPTGAGIPSARERALQYGKFRDAASGSPYYAYQDSTGWHQGWFEDAESLRAKYDFILNRGLGGVAVFPLAYGDEDLHASLVGARSAAVAVAR